ncbi:MAG: autotransporter outer membrane beta-barrel domain-containing protein, partial [Zavarzinia sp.]|nr:autotransporter outer membrane beta-barrel domain-containing protein [Zavarzinia sp.]
ITSIPGVTPGAAAPQDGTPVVIDTLNNRIYVVDSTASGGFRRIDLPGAITPITADFGTTTEDYVDLGAQTVGGCVGSIGQFRTNDPVIVNAFANSLVDCLTLVVVNNPGSFQTRTTVVLRNFLGTTQYQTLVNSYPGVLTFGGKNPYTRRQAQRGDTRFALKSDNASGATSGATGDYVSPDGKFSFYGSLGFDWGSFDQRGTTLGSDFNTFSVLFGGDYEVWDNVYLGGAFSYSGMSNDVSNGTDSQSIDTYNVYLYAVYAEAAAYFQIAMNMGSVLQDTTRVSAGNTITGETSGISWGGQVAAGYDFPVTPDLSVGPIASLRFANLHMGSYNEVGTGAASIGSQTPNALIGALGARTLYSFAASDSETVVLNLRAAWETNFKSGAEPVTVSAVGGGAPFQITPYDSDDSWFNVGGGFTVDGDGYSFYGDFETRLAYEDAEFYFGRFGLRVPY